MRKQPLNKPISFTIILLISAINSFSQNDTSKPNSYESLSLKELLNIKIISVSKKTELLFEAPLSASVITRDEIRKAGCTSIMEALRLSPGLIVREESNGNFDIHIRGMDDVPPNSLFDGNSTTTLVMIDSRPIYNYLKGGTFWETLPVDLNDVEKIEVVRGPAAALYGPNAVSGVINVITKQSSKPGLYLAANAKQGNYETFINDLSVGYHSGKWSLVATGNYQHRDRTQTSYFELNRNRWLDHPAYLISYFGDTSFNVNQIYPDQPLAMKKYAGNIFFNYYPSEKTKISLTAGAQNSLVQTVLSDNGNTPLTTVASESRYADLKINMKNISAQFSYNGGVQTRNFTPGNKYDFQTFDVNVEYSYAIRNFSLKPGISYRRAIYDDTKYSDIVNNTGIFNARGVITTRSASLQGEYKLFSNKLRLVAGFLGSKFNYPDSTYISYQFAATYKFNKNNLVRTVYSRAPRSSTIYDTYINQTLAYYPAGVHKFNSIVVENNKNIKLLTADMLEVGYRCNITPVLSADVEVFEIQSKNYGSLVINGLYQKVYGLDTVVTLPYIPTNLPLKLQQLGVTISLSYISEKLQIKPYITFQQSRIKNYAPFLNTPNAPPTTTQAYPLLNNIYSGNGTSEIIRSTPGAFGGVSINYLLTSKLNGNLGAYYYGKQRYSHASNIIFNDGIRGIDHIKEKLIINATLTYEPVKSLYLSCSAKNLLNDDAREFFRTDAIPFRLLAGINYEF